MYNKYNSKSYNFDSLLCKIQTARQITLNPSSSYTTRIQILDEIYCKAIETINNYLSIDEIKLLENVLNSINL